MDIEPTVQEEIESLKRELGTSNALVGSGLIVILLLLAVAVGSQTQTNSDQEIFNSEVARRLKLMEFRTDLKEFIERMDRGVEAESEEDTKTDKEAKTGTSPNQAEKSPD